jgi:hypothetical protein
MNGFCKDCEEIQYTGKLYHSCTLEGLQQLIFNPVKEGLCCSTSDSSKLFGRAVTLQFEVNNVTGSYTSFDSDSGKNMGYDEFRYTLVSDETNIAKNWYLNFPEAKIFVEECLLNEILNNDEYEWAIEMMEEIGIFFSVIEEKDKNFFN